MTVYHFCFDLNHYGWISQDFYRDPFWTWQRTAIVSLFLLCAGAGQAVALQQGQSWPRFWRRWGQIAGCALLVSVGSYLMYPQSYIYFGVLNGIALMLIIVRLTAHWGSWLWLLGAAAIAMKFIAFYALSMSATLQFLNGKAFNWLGLISVKPVTEDYVPLIPWLGVMWWGMAAGTWALRQRPDWFTPAPSGGRGPVIRGLAWLGRWSLSYYMLHQPVLIGLLMAVGALA
ncbi:MAG: heparan-alpha-glucosaminide N-acetyltransferase [Rhodoferax sp.]|nr:heparan-alpha-glucosaminide N-acetyltransferase [Rhodoferax sp.]